LAGLFVCGRISSRSASRTNSNDSRVTSHGFVPVGNLIGRATEMFWNTGARTGKAAGSAGRAIASSGRMSAATIARLRWPA